MKPVKAARSFSQPVLDRATELGSGAHTHAKSYFARGPRRHRMWQLGRGMLKHDVPRAASAMAFDLFLAAIPMLALGGWLFGTLLKNSQSALHTVSPLLDLTPWEVTVIIRRQFSRFSAGTVAPLAVLGSLWLASSAFHTLMSVFEAALHARRRSWVRKRLISLACVLGAMAGISLGGYVAVLLAGDPIALLEVFIPGSGATAARAITAAVALITCTALLALFFRIAVRRPGIRRRVWLGSVVTMLIGGGSSAAFAHYAKEIARFSEFYGGLAAVAITLAWLWIWCAALLVGAELNAQLEGEEPDRPLRSYSAKDPQPASG